MSGNRILWVVAGGLCAVLAACGGATDPQPSPENIRAQAVVVQRVESGTFVDRLRLSAEVAPWAAVDVTSETSGVVVGLPVEVGDRVAAGDMLVRLDDTEAAADVKRTEAVLRQARATVEQAARDLERGRLLEKTDDIADSELELLGLEHERAVAAVDEAEAAVTSARKRLEDTVIRAPFAGMVSERRVEVGSWVGVGTPVVRLVELARVKVRGAASATDRARLRPGLPVSVTAAALPGAEFDGRVRVLDQEADPATGTYGVEATVTKPVSDSGRLLPGMQTELVVTLSSDSAVLAPSAAVIQRDGKQVVFTVDGGTARKTQPKLGRSGAEVVQVLEGLKPGDLVVVRGQYVLDDGDPVEIERR